jgi:hypothetical protein
MEGEKMRNILTTKILFLSNLITGFVAVILNFFIKDIGVLGMAIFILFLANMYFMHIKVKK